MTRTGLWRSVERGALAYLSLVAAELARERSWSDAWRYAIPGALIALHASVAVHVGDRTTSSFVPTPAPATDEEG